MNTKKYTISKKAKELGFQLIGFTEPKIDAKETNRYKNYLESNYHGDMKWLEKQFELKNKPKKLWEGVKTILILGINYGPGFNPQLTNLKKNIANISVYARNNDYHFVIKNKLEALKRFLDENWDLDSVPFLTNAQANIFCSVDKLTDYHTHTIIVGLVKKANFKKSISTLTYVDGKYR